MKDSIIAELNIHSTEELTHAEQITARIIQLDGIPVLSPREWFQLSNCGYESPEDEYVEAILSQNIKAEQCTVHTYSDMLDITREGDPDTYNMFLQILSQEVEHEEDLTALKEDLELMLVRAR
jgi:bacterioferritin